MHLEHPDFLRDPERIMRPAEIAAFYGIHKRSVQRMFADGRLPKVAIGLRITGARRADVVALTK